MLYDTTDMENLKNKSLGEFTGPLSQTLYISIAKKVGKKLINKNRMVLLKQYSCHLSP